MRERFVEILCCPLCKEGLSLVEAKIINGDILSGILKDRNDHIYPIINGVPVMVIEESGFQKKETVKSFGFEWNWDEQPRTEEDLKFRVFKQCLIDSEFFRNKIILDAGCGAGVQTKFISQYVAGGLCIGLDLSDGVFSAQKNNKECQNVLIVQGDIANPPFRSETFDLVYSEGVLQHTFDPRDCFRKLCKLVKREGYIAAGFYTKREKGITPFLFFREPLRFILSRLPCRLVFYITWLSIPLDRIPFLNKFLRKTILLYDSRNLSDKAIWSINYDFYGPHKFQYYLKPSEIIALWEEPELGLYERVEGKPNFYRAKRKSN
jgi:SAM-dependent methyltransferase